MTTVVNGILTILALVVGIGLAAVVLRVIRAASIPYNLKQVETWFLALDVIVDGQRYQGSRATAAHTINHGRVGIGGYFIHSVFETPSGRVFTLRVTTSFGSVIDWDLQPSTRGVLEELQAQATAQPAPA